ncbi:MAG TPA: phage major capsid protein [Chloroflexota bacterium]|nr:phage major capsid protein [Chloroflexota bacterium]
MALDPITMITGAFNDSSGEIYDQAFGGNVLVKMLSAPDVVKPASGLHIQENISTKKNSTIQARGYKDQVKFEEQDPVSSVTQDWRYVNGGVPWYDAQVRNCQGSREALFDFVGALIDNAKMTMEEVIAQEVWKDGSGNHFHGIPAIISATNTYMTIDRSAAGNEFWRAKTGAAFTLDGVTFGPFNTAEEMAITGGTDGGIRGLYRACCANGGIDPPDVGICDEDYYSQIESLIPDKHRYQSDKIVQLGWPNIMYGKCAITWDRMCPSGSLYMFNTRYLKLRPQKEFARSFKVHPKTSLKPLGLFAEGVLLEYQGNLTCVMPQRCGALTNKTVPAG